MRTRLAHLWELLSSSYWFVPGLMSIGAGLLAMGMLALDRAALPQDWHPNWLYAGGPDGARSVLATIAGSVITVAGVVFSITIAALTMASNQFGPRLLRNFIRDRSNQVVLGTFVATFIYCLLVLRVVQGDAATEEFVPQLSVTAGVALALLSIAVLIYFIHHVARLLQAPIVVGAVSAELTRSIRRFPDDPQENGAGEAATVQMPAGAPQIVCTRESGYIQAINFESLVEFTREHDLFACLEHRAGHYLMPGQVVARVWRRNGGGPQIADENVARAFRDAHIIGVQRTAEQDLEFSIHQLVELAVRALSPGINDPFTAINCVDALGSAICRIAAGSFAPAVRRDRDGVARIAATGLSFDGVVDAALNQLRQHGVRSVAVTIRLLEVIAAAAPQMRTEEQLAPLRRHAELIYEHARAAISAPADLRDLRARYEAAEAATRAQSAAEAERAPMVSDY